MVATRMATRGNRQLGLQWVIFVAGSLTYGSSRSKADVQTFDELLAF
jgi:hypothetical protein